MFELWVTQTTDDRDSLIITLPQAIHYCLVMGYGAEKAKEDIEHELMQEVYQLMHLASFQGMTAYCGRRHAQINFIEPLKFSIGVSYFVVASAKSASVSRLALIFLTFSILVP
jgi:hypothetical protein